LYRLSINPTQGAERFPKRREMAFCLWIILHGSSERQRVEAAARTRRAAMRSKPQFL
jgi:hypothetical protein